MKFLPTTKTNAREALITIDQFSGGYCNLIDEARMNTKFAKESTNLMQVSDGLWKTRWGTNYYGKVFPVNPSVSASVSPSVSASASPSPTPSVSPSASTSVTPSASASRSPSRSASASPSATPSASSSVSPSVSPSESPTASPSVSPSVSESASPSVSPSASASRSPSVSVSASPSPTPSASASVSPSYSDTSHLAADGASEYVKSDGTTELIVIANGGAFKSTDGGDWSAISGATFTEGTQCYFMQIAGYLYIANGTDSLARYNGTTLSTYTSVSAPTNLTASLVASGLSSGTYTYYAEVTALNEVGETVGSTEASITCNKDRNTWTSTTDKITWSWTASAGADRYQLYLSDETGYETLLTSTTSTSFTDDGTVELNPYVEPPLQNTTTAPKFKSMCVSGNRIWATNDPNDMYKVYFSGTGQFMGNFSDFYGGGWINLEKGGREMPVAVKHYQSGSGTGRATVLCKTPDGQGAVWQIDISTATVGDTSFSIPSAQKVVGSFGTESIEGVVATANDIAFPNRRGWFSLGPEKNFYGILRTNERSSMIRPYWRSLISSKMSNVASYFYDAKIFISVPTSTTGNDRIIIYDTERGNWAVDWTIGAKQFLEYTDTSGNSHFLYIPVSGDRLIEISENYMNDLGVKFNQSYISPLIPISKKKTDLFDLKEAIVELAKPRGTINFQILGVDKDNNFTTIASTTLTSSSYSSTTGVGSDLFDDFYLTSTNDTVTKVDGTWTISNTATPSSFTQAITKAALRKRAKLYAIQFKVYSTDVDTDFTILSLQAKGRILERRLPSAWIN